MATTYRYLAIGGEHGRILDWFASLDSPPMVVDTPTGAVLHFASLGLLVRREDGSIDPTASPLASFIPPRRRRGSLWTVGELHFLTVDLRAAYPELDRIRRGLHAWLGQFELVFDGRPGEWDYFLEGSVRNTSADIYALPEAFRGLRHETYFVADDDNDAVIDRVCRTLALRGVPCEQSV